MQPSRRAALVAATCLLAWTKPAAGDGAVIGSVGMYGGYVHRSPVIDDFSTPRNLSFPALDGHSFAPKGSLGLLGVDLRLALNATENVYVPLVGLRVALAIGGGHRTSIPTRDGSFVSVELKDSGLWGELLLPGLGVRGVVGDVRLGGAAQLALVGHDMRGALTYGPHTSEFRGSGLSFAVYADLYACPRSYASSHGASRTWATCVYVDPMIYTGGLDGPSGWASGVLAGVRFDVE